ncbi:unnamed protein product [Schistosoma turkestanicum]|nr:unnamed protein product [Schistosoma turkestanicum]
MSIVHQLNQLINYPITTIYGNLIIIIFYPIKMAYINHSNSNSSRSSSNNNNNSSHPSSLSSRLSSIASLKQPVPLTDDDDDDDVHDRDDAVNDNFRFSFDEIRHELTNLGVTNLNNEQMIRLKTDLDTLIMKERSTLLQQQPQQLKQTIQKSDTGSSSRSSGAGSGSSGSHSISSHRQQIHSGDTDNDSNNHHKLKNSISLNKKLLLLPSALKSHKKVSASSTLSSTSSTYLSVTSEDYLSYYDASQNDCVSVHNNHNNNDDDRLKNSNDQLIRNNNNNHELNRGESVECKSSITDNYSLSQDIKEKYNDSFISDDVTQVSSDEKQHRSLNKHNKNEEGSEQITLDLSPINREIKNLDTAKILSSTSSLTTSSTPTTTATLLLLNGTEKIHTITDQNNSQCQQSTDSPSEANELSLTPITQKLSSSSSSSSASSNRTMTARTNTTPTTTTRTSSSSASSASSTDKNSRRHLESISKDSSAAASSPSYRSKKSSASFHHQSQHSNDYTSAAADQHSYDDDDDVTGGGGVGQANRVELRADENDEPTIVDHDEINYPVTVNVDEHDSSHSNNLSISLNNNELEKTSLNLNELNDTTDYQQRKCSTLTTATTTNTTNSPRRSARFLDDPVEQVHSLLREPHHQQSTQQKQDHGRHHQKHHQRRSKYTQQKRIHSASSHHYKHGHSMSAQKLQRPISGGTHRRQDPVARYHTYQRIWSVRSAACENARRLLRWNIRTAMMHKEIPVLQRNSAEVIRLLGPYASTYLEHERQKRIKSLQLDYIPPTSRRHSDLRQSIRSLMSNPS